jgi:hypothetical protein
MPFNERVNFVFNSASDKWNFLSISECNSVIELAEADASCWREELAPQGPHDNVFKKYSMFTIDRNSKDPAIAWLPQQFNDKLAELNRAVWKFDIDDISDVSVLRYGPDDRLEQHWDLGEGAWDRKLTMLVQLSAPDSYDGGSLEFGSYQAPSPRARKVRCWSFRHGYRTG